ncbi:RNA polymerase sigma factor FliA (plasmid) [Enterobacter asburiae]|uniref:RNA polymerase sigma factor FliA n=1 Tax=Enterobacter asburiae TaxID=61645 RepID=UPI0029321FB1|nr:RNA polymerase sigma factor FliA [Enterobacter asburiae]EMA4739868.1 RNA polymerase sigma factor FliA [Enterobacter asburiae]
MNGVYNQGGVVDRINLWEKYGQLVRHEALRLQVRLPVSVELEDLIQAGAVGLLGAVNDFDSKKEIALTTYITLRVRWALMDELRERDWVPRRVRRNSREIAAVIQRLEQKKSAVATDVEIADAMGVSLQEYQQMLAESNTSQIVSFEDLLESNPDGFQGTDPRTALSDPQHEVLFRNLIDRVSKKIGELPKREQLLLNLYYQQELNMKEVGMILGLTETRVSQLHSLAIKRLRARLDFKL